MKFDRMIRNVFLEAAESGKVDVLIYLRKQGYDIYADQVSTLKTAVQFGQLDVVKYVLKTYYKQKHTSSKQDAKNAKTIKDAFNLAVHYGYFDLTSYFMKKQNMTCKDITKLPLLHMLENCHTEILRYLLEKGLTIKELSKKTGYSEKELFEMKIFKELDELCSKNDTKKLSQK